MNTCTQHTLNDVLLSVTLICINNVNILLFADDIVLSPVEKPKTCCQACCGRVVDVLKLFMIPLYVIIGVLAISVFLLLTVSCIGPLIEYCYAQRDKKLLNRNKIIANNSECFLLDVPGHVNKVL